MTNASEAYGRFCDVLTLAEGYFAAGDSVAAVRLAQVAARYAFPANAGLFASPRLEQLLLELGKRIPAASDRAPPHGGDKRNILHVLTYGRPVGGDSRFVWRWIQEDRDSRHSVAITAQSDVDGIYEMPEALRQAAENSGGFLRILETPTSRPLEQASELRGICQAMDLVVLHLFPWDIIPILALAAGCEFTKTLFINHSDHTFWIGAGVAHSIVHLRRQSPLFLRGRRGLSPGKASVLPIPLDFSPPTLTREQAKAKLGIAPDTVLLLTIASPFKYDAPGQAAFLDLAVPVLSALPQAVLIAVGPEPKGAWQAAGLQTRGRIAPLGARWDNALLYTAADIYLDSLPFSSITSLLEAGSYGAALLGYRLPDPDLELLGPGAPGLDDAMELAADSDAYQALLRRLIRDEVFRRQSARRVQEKILRLHTGSGWLDCVRRIYANVEGRDDRGCFAEKKDVSDASALDSVLRRLYSRQPASFRRLIARCIGTLSYRTRFSITWRLYRIGFELCFLNLLPPPTDAMVRGVWRRMKSLLR
jgi:hypothetical protein